MLGIFFIAVKFRFLQLNFKVLNKKRIVITGGPGTGKSSLINELKARGYTCLEEISRQVILEAQAQGVEQLFLTEPLLFSEQLLKGRKKQFEAANTLNDTTIFYDRGVHDVVAYMNFIGCSYPENFNKVCQETVYNTVFILKPWQAIYTADNERYENFEQAVKIHEHLVKTYHFYNYQLINVPFDTVKNRANYILNTLNM